jgi:hypothetical protein
MMALKLTPSRLSHIVRGPLLRFRLRFNHATRESAFGSDFSHFFAWIGSDFSHLLGCSRGRRLQTRDPASVPDELSRAEKVAHERLQEARTAITQMRVTAARETGLGPALAIAFERFINHTGLSGDFSADVEAARFGDKRSETLLRMAQEALRNVERHAMQLGWSFAYRQRITFIWNYEWKIMALALILKRFDPGITVLSGFANRQSS